MTMPKPPDELEIEAIELREWEADQRTPQADATLAALVKQTAPPPPRAVVRRPSTISRAVSAPVAARPQAAANTVRRTSPVGIPRVVAQPAPAQVIPPRKPPVSETRTPPAPEPAAAPPVAAPQPDPPPVAASAPPADPPSVAAAPLPVVDSPTAPAAPVKTPETIERIAEVYSAYRIPQAPTPAPQTEAAARPSRKTLLVGASAAAVAIAIIALIALTRSPDDTDVAVGAPSSDRPAPAITADPTPAAPPPANPPRASTDDKRTEATPEMPPSKPSTLERGRVPAAAKIAQPKPRSNVELPRPAPKTDSLVQARAAYSLGNQRLFAGDAPGAIAAYRQALALSPGFAAGHRGLGLAYAQQGDKTRARAAFQTYLKLAPGAKDAALIKKRIAAL